MRTHPSLLPWSAVVALAGLLAVSAPAHAQSGAQSASAAPTIGGFDVQGSLSVGLRVTDVTGYADKYRELYNLSDGLRLADFTLFGRAAQGQDLFADTLSMSASGLGGDPYQAVQFMARKKRLYDLRASIRQSRFFWDQNDGTLPTGNDGLTGNHAWSTKRTLGSVNLLFYATNSLRLNFELSHSRRDGMNLTTRSVDFFGSPSSWGSFARANAYTIAAPLHQTANRTTGGFDYTWQDWTMHYRAGYQIFDDAVTANAAAAPEVSINVDDPATANEALQHGAYQDYRRLTSPVSELSYNGKLTPRLEWRGGYMFYRYSGPAGLQAAYDGTARANSSGSVLSPYVLSLDTRTNVTEPTHVIDQGFTWEATDRMNVMVDYRYQWLGIDSTGQFTSLFNGIATTGDAIDEWRKTRNQLDADLVLMPRADLLLRAGVRYLRNNVTVKSDGVEDTYATRLINTVWPTFNVSWKPNSMFNVHADVDSISNDVSYTRLTPDTNVGSRILFKVQPTEQWSIVDAVNLRHQTQDVSDYTADLRSNAITVNYSLNDHLALFGGYTYDSFTATGSASFLRGTPPLDVTIVNDTISHVWQAGLSATPTPRLGVKLAGNYIRTTGEGTITGEAPLYGPLRYPYASGTISYDFQKIGTLSVDVEHIDYTEELVPLNNFGARMVMVRWTRSF